MSKIIECVPNFSEGTDQTKINSIVSSIRSIQGVTVLDCDPGLDTNRTVVTFVGEPKSVIEASITLLGSPTKVTTVLFVSKPGSQSRTVTPWIDLIELTILLIFVWSVPSLKFGTHSIILLN